MHIGHQLLQVGRFLAENRFVAVFKQIPILLVIAAELHIGIERDWQRCLNLTEQLR